MMYSVQQVAEILQVGTDLVRRFVDSGEIDAVDISARRGGRMRLRIPEDSLRRFLEQRRVHVPPPRGRTRRQPELKRAIDYFASPKLEENGHRRFKVSDVAEYLGVKEDHVRQLVAYGHLTAVNVGGTTMENRYRISEKELFAFIERSRNEPKHLRAARLRGPDFLDTMDKQQERSGA